MLALSIASYLSLHPILLLPPLVLLCYDRAARSAQTKPSAASFAVTHTLIVALAVGALLYISYLISGSWQFLSSTYGTKLLLPDLTPNVGLWWYFFIEMFDSFREFFLGVFWLHMISYVPGFTLRFRAQPLFVIIGLTGIMAIFQPYPSVADSALFLGLLPLYRHVFPRKLCQLSTVLGGC
jgi:GPI-anchor transamidase subunit U